MVMHTFVTTRLQSRICSRLRRPDICTGRVLRVLQPATSLVPFNDGKHNGFVDGLEKCYSQERGHFKTLHRLPDVSNGVLNIDPWNDLVDDLGCTLHGVSTNRTMDSFCGEPDSCHNYGCLVFCCKE